MKFEVTHRDPYTHARCGLLHTPHGVIETPVFMPVGTAGSVKAMAQDDLDALGVQILLANTYHLYLRPGIELVRELGGLHRFMGWPGAILTDSGGYQVMSLERLGKVTEDGYSFRSHLDGSPHFLSPELAVGIQVALGSDIMMTLDHCVPYPSSLDVTREAMELTSRWARRSKAAYLEGRGFSPAVKRAPTFSQRHGERAGAAELKPRPSGTRTSLFGIVQGGIDIELRRVSATELVDIGFEGYAIGGLSVGEPAPVTYDIAEHTAARLPPDRPRYLMGVGTPEDIIECVARGIDLFDCVLPTRHARHGSIFTSTGRLAIKNARYARDPLSLDPKCSCRVCRRYSRAYIRHLFLAGELLGPMLGTRHNLHFYLDTMREIRDAIRSGEYNTFRVRRESRTAQASDG